MYASKGFEQQRRWLVSAKDGENDFLPIPLLLELRRVQFFTFHYVESIARRAEQSTLRVIMLSPGYNIMRVDRSRAVSTQEGIHHLRSERAPAARARVRRRDARPDDDA